MLPKLHCYEMLLSIKVWVTEKREHVFVCVYICKCILGKSDQNGFTGYYLAKFCLYYFLNLYVSILDFSIRSVAYCRKQVTFK